MSANKKRLIALGFVALMSLVVGLGWGIVLLALDDEIADCVKGGAAALGGNAVLGVAVILLFPFKEDERGGGGERVPPSVNRPGAPTS
ncbi:hypothetical protein ABZ445_34535 [Streptomyces chartreusis]|uniref:hypothetical protein n=1 Tax=Streptomyces chartreusis TaxID=1969 RepID=UPI0033DBE87B